MTDRRIVFDYTARTAVPLEPDLADNRELAIQELTRKRIRQSKVWVNIPLGSTIRLEHGFPGQVLWRLAGVASASPGTAWYCEEALRTEKYIQFETSGSGVTVAIEVEAL